MRPITEQEFSRIRQQTESRLAGKSQIGFKVMAKESGVAEHEEWIESGFMCDFRLQTNSDRIFHPPSEPYGNVAYDLGYYTDNQAAEAVLPMRYLLNGSFVVNTENNWKGETFDISGRNIVRTYTIDTEFAPFADSIVLEHHYGLKPTDNVAFAITSTFATVDAYILSLASEERVYDDYNMRSVSTGGESSKLFSERKYIFTGGAWIPIYYNVIRDNPKSGTKFWGKKAR